VPVGNNYFRLISYCNEIISDVFEYIPEEGCLKLVSINGVFTGSPTDPQTIDVEYILCEDETNTTIQSQLEAGTIEELIVNECIKQNSLFVGGVNVINETPTTIGLWDIIVDFDLCQTAEVGISTLFVTDPNDSCTLVVDSLVWVDLQNSSMLTSGDVVYNNSILTILFNGGGNYYKMSYLGIEYGVQISATGVLGVYNLCI